MSLVSKSASRQTKARIIERMISHRPFHRMMTRQGIDLTGSWWREFEQHIFGALRRCRRCANAHVCGAWVKSDRPRAEYVRFCPNAGVIEACRILSPNGALLKPEACDPSTSCEPSLEELRSEPIIKCIMASSEAQRLRTSG